MIILEGADGVGKSTLAQSLAERLAETVGGDRVDWRSVYRHMTRPPDDFDHLTGYLDVSGRVQDRYHLGAIVYGQLLGLGGYPTASRMRLVQRYLRWQGCITVVLHGERDWLRERLRVSPKAEMYSIDRILDANDAYRALVGSSNRGEPYCQLSWDVTLRGWPGAQFVETIVKTWRDVWLR